MKASHQLFTILAIAILGLIPTQLFAQPCFPVLNPNNDITIDVVNFNGLPAPPADIYLNATNDMEIVITNANPAVSVVYISAWLNQDGTNTYQPVNQIITNVPMTFPFGPATYGIQSFFTTPAGPTLPVTSILITVTPAPIPPNPCLPMVDGPSLEIESRNHSGSEIFAVIGTDGLNNCFDPYNPYACGNNALCPHPTGCASAIPQYNHTDRLVGEVGALTYFPNGIGNYIGSAFTQTARVYEEVATPPAPNSIQWQFGTLIKTFNPVLDVIHSNCTGDWAPIPTSIGGGPSGGQPEIVADFAFDPPNPFNTYHVFYWIDGQQIFYSNGVPNNVVVPLQMHTVNGMQGKDYGGEFHVCGEGHGRYGLVSESLPLSEGITVYPNPFAGQTEVTVELNESRPVQIQLMDLQGRMLHSQVEKNYKAGNHRIPLHLEEIPSGLFILQVQIGESLYTEKIMKNF